MSGLDRLLEAEGRWVTSMGKWFPGERVVLRGVDLLYGLRDMRWMEHMLFAITGRRFSEEQVKLFEGIWRLSVGYPDPRIWPNRPAALAATARSTATLGVSSALAISEAELFGHRSNIRVIDFFLRARELVDQGRELTDIVKGELKTYRWVPGYGRPLVRSDERIEPLADFARSLGLGDGRYVRMAFEVDEILRGSRYPMRMNVGGLGGALAADQGLTRSEYHRYIMLGMLTGMVPCYIDADAHEEGTFFPIRCERLICEGEGRRSWDE